MIETTNPTTPVIQGGETTWSQVAKTISVKTVSTAASGIKNYQYCEATTNSANSCAWNNLASNVTSVSISTNGTKYIFFRAVSNAGRYSSASTSQTTMIDTTNPTISINSNLPTSITKGDSYPILGSYAANGPSSGSASCSSDRDGAVEDTKQLTTIGSHIITCTVTTGAKKSVSTTKTINITYTSYQITNLVTNGSFEKNGISEWYNQNKTEFWLFINLNDYPYIPQLFGNYAFNIHVNNDQSFARASYNTTSTLANHKVYARVWAMIDYGTDIDPGLYLEFSEGSDLWSTPSQNHSTWYSSNGYDNNTERRIWRSLALYETATYNYLKIMLAQGNGTGNGVYMFDGLTVVDLTAAFGAGNEPNKDWCDKHINYFDGTTEIYK